jgi:hypothetical protein
MVGKKYLHLRERESEQLIILPADANDNDMKEVIRIISRYHSPGDSVSIKIGSLE